MTSNDEFDSRGKRWKNIAAGRKAWVKRLENEKKREAQEKARKEKK